MARRPLDIVLIVVVLILLLFSVCFVFTASSAKAERDAGDSTFFLKRQLLRLAAGLLLLFIMSRVDYHHVIRGAPILHWMVLLLLVGLLFAPESWQIRGSRRWLMLGSLRVQPSELAKFTLVAYLAALLAKSKMKLDDFKNDLLPILIIVSLTALAVLLEPDLGTAIILATVPLLMLFISGARARHLFALATTGVVAALAFTWREAYQRGRLQAFFETLLGQAEPGWQVKQSLIGLGNGGLLGLGLGKSKQKLQFLPDPFTDFIMSIIGEELGLLGTVAVIALFLIILWRGFRISRQAPDPAGRLLALSITWTIVVNAFVNVAVVTNLLPTTGIPLPFISYGGSALIANLLAIGVLLNISTYCGSRHFVRKNLSSVPLARVNWYRDRKR